MRSGEQLAEPSREIRPANDANEARADSSLKQRYLIALNIPVYAWRGGLYTDRLWLLDLQRHLDYIESPVLFCPRVEGQPPHGCEILPTTAPFDRLRIIGVPEATSLATGLALAPSHMRRAWAAVRDADIVHGGGVGWPIPLGYYCAIAARLQRKFHISIMESSPWRVLPNESASLGRRVRAWVMERMARWIARGSQLALFTTVAYRDSMVGPDAPNGHVFKASWIPEHQLTPMPEVERRWSERPESSVLRIGFAARLTVEKGTRVLLESLAHLDPGRRFEVNIIGEGPCSAEIRAAQVPPNVNLRLLATVDYGDSFFRVLDGWDCIVVPSLSDEQPRIIYDAFARGLPVIASRTSALTECITDRGDGLFFPVGDSRALAAQLSHLASHRDTLRQMAYSARRSADLHTHAKMHADRRVLIDRAWAAAQ